MRAMVLETPGPIETGDRLVLRELPVPEPGHGQLLIRVTANGVCRTDLHVVEGELGEPKLPLIPGHQIVGVVERTGGGVEAFAVGDRVGVPWLGSTCGHCRFCAAGAENLCDDARFTGYQLDGGYAEYAVAEARFAFSLPGEYGDVEVAPLLCAGLIGYRALRMTGLHGLGAPPRLGIYGFGAAAHIVTQVAIGRGAEVFAFTRGVEGQAFARELGAVWAGGGSDEPPTELDAAIIFAPAGELVPAALRAVRKGGTVVTGGIHMSDIPAFPYELLWGERVLRSVANLTREDGEQFLELAPSVPVKVETTAYPLDQANRALADLKSGKLRGAAVLTVQSG
ncbi:MAG: zinc-dependent alcohol dehydrogenase family protein [Actinobacteria bacterium]|nr:zinc-dependent alcohol dehydrogenase family protein [Actinomycetota bacterium]